MRWRAPPRSSARPCWSWATAISTPAAKAKPLAAAIAGARTVVIPNSGHFMIVERPDETLEALKSSV